MDQADSVHSTPPINTSKPQTHLVDATMSRRRFLSQAAGVAAGGTSARVGRHQTSKRAGPGALAGGGW